MKKIYADLHLCPNLGDHNQASTMIHKASQLGYSLIAVSFPPNFSEDQKQTIQETCKEAKIGLATRVDLKPKTPGELVSNLRRLRRKFEIIAVTCETKNVARQAAKDRRVDLVNFQSVDYHQRFFDHAEAELASNGLAALEIVIKSLLVLEGQARTKLLFSLRREIAIAQAFHVPIILSSGVSDKLLMREPMALVALSSLFDLNRVSAIDAISKNPKDIYERNKSKLSSKFVAPGIRIIRRGKDC